MKANGFLFSLYIIMMLIVGFSVFDNVAYILIFGLGVGSIFSFIFATRKFNIKHWRQMMESRNYRFVWKAIKYYRKQGGEIVNTPSFIIGLEDKTTKEVFPHPISHFLFKNYHRNSGSVNTELTVAQIIVPFLNFVLDKVNQELTEYTEIKGLEDLQENHANAYLQYCVDEKSNKNSTLQMKENFLSRFYKYLWEASCRIKLAI